MIPYELQKVIITEKPRSRLWYEIGSTVKAFSLILAVTAGLFFLAVFQKQVGTNSEWFSVMPKDLLTVVWLYFPEALCISVGINLIVILLFTRTDWQFARYGDWLLGGVASLFILFLLANPMYSSLLLNSGFNYVRVPLLASPGRVFVHEKHLETIQKNHQFYGQITRISDKEIVIDNFGITQVFLLDQEKIQTKIYIGEKVVIQFESGENDSQIVTQITKI